ncbi:MAG: zinc ribbon domain-containing protein [Polyangiaceae bacterium]
MPIRLNELALRLRPFSPILLVLLVVGVGVTRGIGMALLALAGSLLLLAIAGLWQSVQSISDDAELSLDEAFALAAPSAEEEKKRSVLRALKDLEYERGVGKISEEDYLALTTRYRQEAKTLLQALEKAHSPARQRVEEMLEKRLAEARAEQAKKAAAAPPPPPDDEDDDDEDDEGEGEDGVAVSREAARAEPASLRDDDDEDDEDETAKANEGDDGDDEDDDESAKADEGDDGDDEDDDESGMRCAKCDTVNDLDARFCKHCGGGLG